jgi:outer membrane lipoprotein-sorting protein
MAKVLTLCLLFLLVASIVCAQQNEPRSAREILDKMVSVYASCSSYADKGESKEVFLNNRHETLRPFSTAFVRPSQFRFEFEEISETRSTNYVVWQDSASIKSWWSIRPEVRFFETLDLALAGAAGVSRGASIQVPSMLFGDLHDTHRIQNLSQLALIGEEKVGGKVTYKITGLDWRGNQVTVWIEKESFLLLKTFEIVKPANSPGAEQTTTYKPQLNLPIPPDKLAFKY